MRFTGKNQSNSLQSVDGNLIDNVNRESHCVYISRIVRRTRPIIEIAPSSFGAFIVLSYEAG